MQVAAKQRPRAATRREGVVVVVAHHVVAPRVVAHHEAAHHEATRTTRTWLPTATTGRLQTTMWFPFAAWQVACARDGATNLSAAT